MSLVDKTQISMIKKFTGVEYTPQEFRKLNQCLRCGKATTISKESLCEKCAKENLPNCEMCEIILKKGVKEHFLYDTKEYKREEDLIQKVSKELVKEFSWEEDNDNIYSKTLCKSCQDWESRMRNICWLCDNSFINSRENYKLNGNMCPECATLFQ